MISFGNLVNTFSATQGILNNKVNKQPENTHSISLKTLTQDTVSFSGATSAEASRFIDESTIKETVAKFSDAVVGLSLSGSRLTPNNLNAIIKNLVPKDAKVMLQQASMDEMGAVAYCMTGFDNQGKPVVGLFVDFNNYAQELIQNLAHEFTHVLQALTPKQDQLLNDSMAKGEDAHYQLEEITNAVEDKLLVVINKDLATHESAINQKLMSNTATIDEVIEEFKLVSDAQFKKDLDSVLSENAIKPDLFTLNYMHNRATKEIEAYKEGNQAYKKAYQFEGMLYTFDVIPKLYERWANFLQTEIDNLSK